MFLAHRVSGSHSGRHCAQRCGRYGLGVNEGAVFTLVKEPVRTVLTASQDMTAKMWNSVSGECLTTFAGHMYWVSSAIFSPNGTSVLTRSYDKTAKLWSAASGECLTTFAGHDERVTSAVFSSDGSSVLTASYDETAKLWSTLLNAPTRRHS